MVSFILGVLTSLTFLHWIELIYQPSLPLLCPAQAYTLCPKKVSPLNILQQPPQTCTDLNEILHTQDDIYFCHRRQISYESLIPFTRCSILSNCCHKSQLPIQLTSCWRHLWWQVWRQCVLINKQHVIKRGSSFNKNADSCKRIRC